MYPLPIPLAPDHQRLFGIGIPVVVVSDSQNFRTIVRNYTITYGATVDLPTDGLHPRACCAVWGVPRCSPQLPRKSTVGYSVRFSTGFCYNFHRFHLFACPTRMAFRIRPVFLSGIWTPLFRFGLTRNCASLDISRSGDVIRRKNDRRVARCAFHVGALLMIIYLASKSFSLAPLQRCSRDSQEYWTLTLPYRVFCVSFTRTLCLWRLPCSSLSLTPCGKRGSRSFEGVA
jgi:hypothetical protein